MRVLLVSANTETINMPVLPIGLVCVAEAARRAGHRVELLNLMGRQDPLSLLQKTLEGVRPRVIGISIRNIDDQNMENPAFMLGPVKQLVSACRRSGATVVLGGAGYSIFPRAALEFLGADLGIQGEGEAAFAELLFRLENDRDLKGIAGLYFRGRKQALQPRRIAKPADVPLSFPDIGTWIPADMGADALWVPVQSRRGCPLGCSYCSTASIEGRKIRKYPPEMVAGLLNDYVAAGFRRFFFVDNTFNLPPSYAGKLCDRIRGAVPGIEWRCILYPWKVDAALVEKMASAGCREVAFGFESGSPQILRKMNKKYSLADVRRTSAILEDFGISRMGFLLLGGPGETRESVMESLTFADALKLESVKVTAGIRIYPETALFRAAVAEGRLAPDDALLSPRFYLAEGLEGWLRETLNDWMKDRPNWVR